MKCPNCNKEVQDGSKFCNHCGHKFEKENTIKCTNCGHMIPADSKFCPDCGEKINIVDYVLDSSINDDTSYYMPFFAPNGKVGFKDRRNGQTVIEAIYDFAQRFSEGLAVVVLNNKYGFIDVQGHVKIPFMYDNAYSFKEGLAVVENCDGDLGFINLSGKEVIPAKYCRANSFNEGLALVGIFSINDNIDYTFINKRGNIVIDCSKYDEVCDFKEGLAAVERNNLWGFINQNGKEVIPCKYNNVDDFYEGLAVVTNNDWVDAFIDRTGKIVLPFRQRHTWHFSDGLAPDCYDQENEKYGYIDEKGLQIIPYIYSDAREFHEGLAAVDNGEGVFSMWGFIDKYGNTVIPFEYDEVEDFCEGIAAVSDGTHWGFIDKTGNLVIDMRLDKIYDDANFAEEGWMHVKFKGKSAVIDIFGNIKSMEYEN